MSVHSFRHSWIQGSHSVIGTQTVCPTLLSSVLAPLRQTAGLGTVAGCQQVCTYVLFFQRLLFPAESSPKLQLLINWAIFPSLHHSLFWVDKSAVDQSLGQSIRVKHFEKGTLRGHQGAWRQNGEWMPAGKPTDILPGLQAS